MAKTLTLYPYFAYGSNMNPQRMAQRVGFPPQRNKAILYGYRLAFNKLGDTAGSFGYANIERAGFQCSLEGYVYWLTRDEIRRLDMYEGFPKHYTKESVVVESAGEKIKCYAYVAVLKVPYSLPVRVDYASHIQLGVRKLSKRYRDLTQKIQQNLVHD